MKEFKYIQVIIFISSILLLSCKKEHDTAQPQNPPVDTKGTRKFQVTLDSLPGQSISYSFHSEGYPTQVVTKYRIYLTGQHAETLKAVYRY